MRVEGGGVWRVEVWEGGWRCVEGGGVGRRVDETLAHVASQKRLLITVQCFQHKWSGCFC